jgi:pimeloyl-ACP methyl ester carboxylesterase
MRTSLLAMLAAACALCAATPAHCAGNAPGASRFVEARGAKFHVETFGSGAPIVFLHGGLNFFDNMFAGQRDAFAADRMVIGIDRRGHGHSPDNDKPFSYREMAEDMAAVIEQLGVGPVDVVGHSDGGTVGLILARDHPGLVRRLVVSGAHLRAGLPADELQRRRSFSPEQLAEKLKQVEAMIPKNFKPDYQKVAPDGPAHWDVLLGKSYQLWLTPVVIEAAELKTIRIPVLVMAGDHDFAPIEDTVEIYRNLPQGQLFILPASGHGTMAQYPELANLAMREFFARPDKVPAAR